jgi:hypothetical protein
MYLAVGESGVRFRSGTVTRFPVFRNEKAMASQYFRIVDRPGPVVRWIGFQTVGAAGALELA